MRSGNRDFAALGEVFNDATARMLGGVGPQNQHAILRDIDLVQRGLANLLQTNPGQFDGVSAIHVQNIVDQLNLERQAINSIGTDPFAPKYINDVQRDLIDIVQGDETLAALATANGRNGFGAVPDVLAPPAQFQGNAEQTEFMRNFATTATDLATRAAALADGPANPAEVAALTAEVQAFGSEANAFTVAQGGIYSARFNNEFASDGVNGTASRALIEGLQTGNANLVHAAADVLAANAQDVAGNMLGIGDDPPQIGNGIPDVVDTIAVAGTVFNDATAKLIGGVYDGNRQSIHDDLIATRQGFEAVLASGELDRRAVADAGRVIDLLGRELAIVDSESAGAGDAAKLNKLHTRIIDVVQGDKTLAALADAGDANGFMALPDARTGLAFGSGHGLPDGQGPGRGHGHAQAGDICGNGHASRDGHGTEAAAAKMTAAALSPIADTDPLAHIFPASDSHHLA